jgi:hypothetical protein
VCCGHSIAIAEVKAINNQFSAVCVDGRKKKKVCAQRAHFSPIISPSQHFGQNFGSSSIFIRIILVD